MKARVRIRQSALAVVMGAAACAPADDGILQGYVEGEFVLVASPFADELQQLLVQRGGSARRGDALFALEDTTERAAVERQRSVVAHAHSRLADEKKGGRPSELASLEAQLGRARAAKQLAEIELRRTEKLAPSGAASANELDRARADLEQDVQGVLQLEADVQTARLGAREDRIAAAEA